MSNIGFHRSKSTQLLARKCALFGVFKYLAQRFYLNGVAQRCSGAMCLNVGNLLRLDVRVGKRLLYDAPLSLDTRRGITDFKIPIIINSRAFDDCVDVIAISNSLIPGP